MLGFGLSSFLLIFSDKDSHLLMFSLVSHNVLIVPLDIVAIILQLFESISSMVASVIHFLQGEM